MTKKSSFVNINSILYIFHLAVLLVNLSNNFAYDKKLKKKSVRLLFSKRYKISKAFNNYFKSKKN